MFLLVAPSGAPSGANTHSVAPSGAQLPLERKEFHSWQLEYHETVQELLVSGSEHSFHLNLQLICNGVR